MPGVVVVVFSSAGMSPPCTGRMNTVDVRRYCVWNTEIICLVHLSTNVTFTSEEDKHHPLRWMNTIPDSDYCKKTSAKKVRDSQAATWKNSKTRLVKLL